MRGGGGEKDRSRNPKEHRLLQGLQTLLKSLDEESESTDDGEAKLLAALNALIRDDRQGSLLQQLKSLVTQATKSMRPSREPKQKVAADTQKSQTFYTSWLQTKCQKASDWTWADVASTGRAQWANDGWHEIAWKPRQDDRCRAGKVRVGLVTSFMSLSRS
jgi:hypothetical protein